MYVVSFGCTYFFHLYMYVGLGLEITEDHKLLKFSLESCANKGSVDKNTKK